jgi:fatty-acyl-CoA synthase
MTALSEARLSDGQEDSLGSFVRAAAARAPNRPAIIGADGVSLTWTELESRSNQIARALRASGARPGERLMAVLGERAEYALVNAAALKAGLVVVLVSWRYQAPEIRDIAEDAEPSIVVYEEEVGDTVRAGVADLRPGARMIEISEWMGMGVDEQSSAFDEASGDDIAYIGYTSGTTGKPKGATFDHRTCRRAAITASLSYGMPHYGTGIISGSLSYVTVTLVHFWSHVYMTSCSVILGRFDPERLVSLIAQHAGTFTYLPTPTIAPVTELLRKEPRALGSMRSIVLGASPIPPDTLRELVELAGPRVRESYGSTEGAGVPICLGTELDWRSEPEPFTSVGRVVAPAVIRLMDSDGEFVGPDEEVGELAVKTPLKMREYWRNPDATEQAIRNGWMRMGDQASIAPDGRVEIKGRTREMINSGGAKVYPVEVEAVISRSPRVLECAVVGMPHERWGETPVAFVVPAASADGLEDHISELCRAELAAYKCPTAVRLIAELPRNANNKILKRVLVGT